MLTPKNYRPNYDARQLPGACTPHYGQVIADLYDKDDNFVRQAVVAETSGLAGAEAYCREVNPKPMGEQRKRDIDKYLARKRKQMQGIQEIQMMRRLARQANLVLAAQARTKRDYALWWQAVK